MITGYIEGYYGRYLGWDERARLIERLAEGGGSVFVVAAKEDPFHRQAWREPYPKAWLKACGDLARKARRQGVEVMPGMAPGLSYDYTSRRDYADLLRKFKAFQRSGCRRLALLMDDIPAVLPAASQGRFRSLGEAHGLLLQRLRADLGEGLWFCPTVYCDTFSAKGDPASDPYLADLAATAPADIPVFWTGKGIVPREVTPADLRPLQRLFPGRVMLWDNLYAHDYCPWKIFLGPFLGRPQSLRRNLGGLLINPTGLPLTDAIYLDQVAAWRRGESPRRAWSEAMRRAEVPAALQKLLRYLWLPQEDWEVAAISPAAIEKARAALKPFIWNWKSPLQREWYPYLFMLDADLRVAAGQDLDPAWVRKRYPPAIAEALLRRRRPS